jgi:hypothetical protein
MAALKPFTRAGHYVNDMVEQETTSSARSTATRNTIGFALSNARTTPTTFSD